MLDENDVVAVMAALEQEGDLQRAIDIGSDWLKQTSEESYRPAGKVERARRRLIGESGGAGEALNEAWQAFEEQPSAEVLDELREVVGSDERPEIDRKAAQIVGDDAYLLMSIVSQTEPGDALARAVADLAINELRDISSWTLRQAAERLDAESPETGWPEAAVQVYAALGWRHVDRGKSKYYDLAVDAFERARDLYRALGREHDWEQLVVDVGAAHGRKHSFMAGFRRLSE